ncbi:hypothetical protein [Arenibacter lacus]|uniref:hypothetical protein n=1 Tax=Arenibacter lacus TaxID=2608629 RepID=UPI00123DF609|nr:hypothetical protein [Arenibacter lacus]
MKRSLRNIFFQHKAIWRLGVLFLALTGMPQQSRAQTKVLANEITYTSGKKGGINTSPTVENPNNSLSDNDDYARLLASPGLAAGLGSYKGIIELKFAQTLPADRWSYVRMEGDSDLFRALLGGSLGNTLGTVLGAVLIGNQEVIIDARMGSTSVFSRSSTLGFGTDRVKLIQDGGGNNYLAIRPANNYDRLRITNQIGSLLGVGNEKTLDVYNAFYYEDTGDDCGRPFATSFDGGGGIGLEVADLNDQNLSNAIDNDLNTFSRLKSSSILDVNVASTLSQYFYFPSTSAGTTTANIKLALGSGGLVNTDLLGAVEIIFFEDNTIVSRKSLQSSLLNNTNALTLLDNGDPVTLTFAPGKAFDRIAIKLSSPVGVNLLGNGVKIYDVQRYDDAAGCPNPEIAALPFPTEDPFESASCASSLIHFDNVDFAEHAVDGNNESYATLYADSGNLLVSGSTTGFIEMDLGQTVPANKTTYVRVNYDQDVLDRLLGGSLGKLVGDLANSLLLGNQFFEVEANNGDTNVLTATSSDAFEGTSNGVVTLVQDNIGRYYIAITPNADYNRVRITNHVVAVLPTGKKASLDVYNACFEIGTESCSLANFTSYRGGGVGLNLGNISNVGVTNAYRTISGNSSDYSEINLGVAGLAAHVYQTIYFSQPSKANDKVKIRLAIEPSSPLSLDVLGRYQIKFFNGATQVGTSETLESGLINNIDVVALFNSGGIVELEYEPTGTFDRVDIGAESIASVNVATEPLRVYSVERYGDNCTLTNAPFPFEEPSCSTTLIDAHNADNLQNLFDDDFDSYATLKSGAGVLFGLGNKYEAYVEMGYEQPVSAGTTSYVRIDFEESILEGLLGGSLGNVVSGLLDGLVLGDHYFKVEVKNANGAVIEHASSNLASTGGNSAIRVVQDVAGRYYIAVTPTADYQSVRITDATNSALGLLAQPNTMNIYGMCHETSQDNCMEAFATSYEINGINLTVNQLSGMGVDNPHYAIDKNSSQGSLISNGTLAVGASTKQWIFFNNVFDADGAVNISFKTQAGAVDLDLLGSLEIKAYLGDVEVASIDWHNGFVNGVNVLQLLSNGAVVNLPFKPGVPFDRITVGIRTTVGASVFPPVELFDVEPCVVFNTKLLSNPNITNKLRN